MRTSASRKRAVLSLLYIALSILLVWLAPGLIAHPTVRSTVSPPESERSAAAVLGMARLGSAAGIELSLRRTSQAQDPAHRGLFREWQKPSAVIVFSGQQHGYLEPCGCSPEFQKGGLARRFGFVKSLQQKNWPLVLVDLGGLLDGHSQPGGGKFMVGPEQAQAKLDIALQALHLMQYSVLNLGPEDIEVPQGFVGLMGLLINIDNPPFPRVINANLGVSKDWVDAKLIFPYIIRDVAGQKIAFIGMVGEKCKDMVDQEFNGWQAPDKVLQNTLKKLTQASSIQVLMLYGNVEEAKKLAKSFPDLDVIIYGSNDEEPSDRPEWVGKTMLVTIGSKGKYTGAIGIFKNEPRFRFELAPLDDRFEEDATIRQLLDDIYIKKLADLDLVVKAPKEPCDLNNLELGLIGSKKCGECHEKVYEFWLTTRHSHALETLVDGYQDKKHNKRIAAGKHVNPECVSCHTTGFFNQTGYDGTQATQHLGGNGCENCHGPGSVHARLMSNPDVTADESREAKKMMHLGPQDDRRNVCTRCHDSENSPKFELAKYWDQVDHGAEATEDKENWPKVLEKLRAKKNIQE